MHRNRSYGWEPRVNRRRRRAIMCVEIDALREVCMLSSVMMRKLQCKRMIDSVAPGMLRRKPMLTHSRAKLHVEQRTRGSTMSVESTVIWFMVIDCAVTAPYCMHPNGIQILATLPTLKRSDNGWEISLRAPPSHTSQHSLGFEQ